MLAPYAVRDTSAHRKHPEPEHPYRTAFQRDRDRIIHCSAFRRLDFKTQVFVPHEDDYFRTRLTHTLEVSQVARSIGRALRLNEDLIEAVALAHDLGHPPFGHAGEKALDELMADHGRFEHNRHSLRVVDYLEHPYPNFRGLNLTDVARECLAKHETKYDTPICEDFDTESKAPLEGQVVDQADEIAYTAADLEDALSAKWIDEEDLAELALWRHALARTDESYPGARPIHRRIRACKAIIADLADDLISHARLAIAPLTSPDDARRLEQRGIVPSPSMSEALEQMQQFLVERVYRHPNCRRKDDQSRRVIAELFGAYVADPGKLHERYRRRIDRDGLERVCCDYIAGMTDRYCSQRHDAIFGG